MRADSLGRLTPAGWRALWHRGVRTVVDLRNDDEVGPDAAPRPDGLTTVRVPLDVAEDREFWREWQSGPQFGTPLYYRPHLERFASRNAEAVRAVARAQQGGVVFHCMGGCDRTGQLAMLVLSLVCVRAEAIAVDYALSAARRAEQPELDAFLAGRGTSARDVVVSTLAELDVAALLREGGLSDDDVAALRQRMLPL